MHDGRRALRGVLVTLALVVAQGALGARACGYERWSVKTLQDPAAARLSRTPVDTSIAAVDARHAPADPDAILDRLAPFETTLWRLRARLVGYRLERDRDLHLVLHDPQTGASMVGEIPSPHCTLARWAPALAAARAAVVRLGHHRATRRWWWLDYRGATPPLVLLQGYGFFDRLHEVTGQSPNGAELHPIVAVRAP